MNHIYLGQNKLTPQQRDDETLAAATKRIADGKATEKLMEDQGKMEGGLNETEVA